MNTATQEKTAEAQYICALEDLVPNSGVCALWQNTQIALFYIPSAEPRVYAVSNWDPIGKAEVISRGMVGDIDGQLVVASPLYKQRFALATGTCIEDPDFSLKTFQVVQDKEGVWLQP